MLFYSNLALPQGQCSTGHTIVDVIRVKLRDKIGKRRRERARKVR